MKVRADLIKRALAKRHTDDFFLTEVKNGPSWGGGVLIMDAFAMKKSWANPCLTGYEIKVSRNDFLQDKKWPGYLGYCHKFYFACPTGLIQPEELPEEVGLIYYNLEKGTLYTKKAAKYRMVEPPKELYIYMIMTRLESDRHPFFNARREFFEAYVEDKVNLRDLGRQVRTKMMNQLCKLQEEIEELKYEVKDLERQAEQLERVKSILKEYGLNVYYWNLEDELRKAISTKQSPKVIEIAERMKRYAEQLYALTQKAE